MRDFIVFYTGFAEDRSIRVGGVVAPIGEPQTIIADFDKRNVKLVALAENFDMTHPFGRAMAQMARVFAEL